MKLFDVLYEVYRRDNKTIISQGTKEECDKLAEQDWYYSVRLSKQELYTKDEVLTILNNLNTFVSEGIPMEIVIKDWIEKNVNNRI